MTLTFTSPLPNLYRRITDLETALRTIRDIHQPYTFTHTRHTTSGEIDIDIEYCTQCVDHNDNHMLWPCATYETVTQALKGLPA